ncbi:helix-turn-helix transcriptional regulator [Oricola nitratireducens]|jgi:DNA-binding CsgD family transcriptional regulator|uniref:helix-turn-helix transcriptional regulator n=1 Tax=Oricola nitratireducens TaxID=2775868 RepID=UPI0018680986|nr:LuxR family transcriptional regulator [Oricola nitratireducens]
MTGLWQLHSAPSVARTRSNLLQFTSAAHRDPMDSMHCIFLIRTPKLHNPLPLSATQDSELVARITGCKTSYDVLRLIREIAKTHGFEFFSIIRLPQGDERQLASVSIISNWPPELISSYDRLGLLESSPVIKALRKTVQPFIWNLHEVNRERASGHGSKANELFAQYGFEGGVHFPTQDPSGGRGAVSFAGKREKPSSNELFRLSFISNLLYERVSEIGKADRVSEQTLSARERECLHWTASGKTSQEIATILGLSEHTVNHYLSAACQKLGAANRAHAVAKAIRAGFLD